MAADPPFGHCQLDLRCLTQRGQQIERYLRVILVPRQGLKRQQIHCLLMQLIHRGSAILRCRLHHGRRHGRQWQLSIQSSCNQCQHHCGRMRRHHCGRSQIRFPSLVRRLLFEHLSHPRCSHQNVVLAIERIRQVHDARTRPPRILPVLLRHLSPARKKKRSPCPQTRTRQAAG